MGGIRIEDLRRDAFNEGTTLQASVERFRKAYGHYPARVLADRIFRTRENLRYCKEHGIQLNGPKRGKPHADTEEAPASFAHIFQKAVFPV
ncbi:MAG: transposase [Fretibacterium sp.]|nr:transposase [Fretibacterium sp.]